MKKLTLIIALALVAAGCEKQQVHCYVCEDAAGNKLYEVCGTEEDARLQTVTPEHQGAMSSTEFSTYCKKK